MMCEEQNNPEKEQNNTEQRVNFAKYHHLPPQNQKLIADWFELACETQDGDAVDCFKAFIAAWISFNAWAACISGLDEDCKMISALKQDETLCKEFHELFTSDSRFAEHTEQFGQLWPIFKVMSARNVHSEGGDDRKKIIKSYFDAGAQKYSPQSWKWHEDQSTFKGEIDWPSTLDALYRVRCNLFHGEKALSSENDKRIVSSALHVLVCLFEKFKQLE